MEWQETFSVKIPKIDKQHKILIDLITNVETIHNSTEDPEQRVEKIKDILEQLLAYTEFHFKEEENMMKQFHYPQTTEHIKIHHKLIDSLKMLQQKFIEKGIEVIPVLREFLVTWLSTHILKIDMQYSAFLHPNKFEMTKELMVNVDIMDHQHQSIIDFLNRITYIKDRGDSGLGYDIKEISIVLQGLTEYTKTHFHDEETLLERHSYPHLAQHKAIHRNLIEKLDILLKRLPSEKEKLVPAIHHFLKEWLLGHIKNVDKKYSEFVGKKEKI